jgi:short-subunit dehydrogenase
MGLNGTERKLAVVTGATSGIGAAYARLLARSGYDILMTGRRMEMLEVKARALSEEFHVDCRAEKADLSTEAGIARLCLTLRESADIDVLVSNAGMGLKEPFLRTPTETLLEMIRVHDMAAVALVHTVLPAMLERGRGNIICISSLASLLPRPGSELYTPSKAFLNSFIQCLDLSHRGRGLRFQALCPSFTHTDFHERIGMGKELQVDRGLVHWAEPDEVVAESWRKLAKGNPVCVPGAFNRRLVGLLRALPRGLRAALLS